MTTSFAGFAGLAACVALAMHAAVVTARASGEDLAGRFWIVVTAVAVQFGATACTLSLLHAVSPLPWLVVQAAVAAASTAWWRRAVAMDPPRRSDRDRHASWPRALAGDRALAATLAATAWAVAVSLVEQLRTPIGAIDDLTYVAARVAHWMQNGDLLRYTTGNERQVAFPFGGELFLLLPLLFTKTEAVGRAFAWTALPAVLAGLGFTLREAGAGRRATALALLVFATTPLVYGRSVGVKPELWATLHVLGAVFWASRGTRRRDHGAWMLAGVSAALAVGAKPTTMGALPALALAPFLFLRPRDARVEPERPRMARARAVWPRAALANLARLAAGFVLGLVAGGAALPLAQNVAAGDTPFGSRAMVAVHAAEPGLAHLPVHAARFGLRLLELPFLPDAITDRAGPAMQAVAQACGADVRLPLERETGWPGAFEWKPSSLAQRLSLAGLAWMPALALLLARLARRRRDPGRERGEPDAAGHAALVSASLVVAVVFGSRWQESAEVPFRFLVPAFAAGLLPVAVVLERACARRRSVRAIVLASAAFAAVPGLAGSYDTKVRDPRIDVSAYLEATRAIPAGSRILHVASQSAPEYLLFAPESGYANLVFPWGWGPLDLARFDARLDESGATHVLVQDDRSLSFHWRGRLDPGPLVGTLDARSDLRRIHLADSHVRLYARTAPTIPSPPPHAQGGLPSSSASSTAAQSASP